MSNLKALKKALVSELCKQLEDGPVVMDKDGEPVRISPTAAVMSVAAKVVKDFADEAADDAEKTVEAERLSKMLERRRAGAQAPSVQ